ncbi:MAG: thioredoxin family protein [Aeropyrum sp.]|nr:thioredoxin family protein [Aeropyrum sp.]MCE4615901.1 thioredoxin family protein [Aeropyrum sp.]
MNAKLIIGLFLGVVMVASTFIVVFTGLGVAQPRQAPQEESFEEAPLEGYFPTVTFKIPLSEGDSLTLRAVSQGPEGTRTAVNRVTVDSVGWPESGITLEVLEAGDPVATSTPQSGALATTMLALPLDMLDSESITIPVYIPPARGGLCMTLDQTGVGEGEFGEVVSYEGAAQVGDYAVTVELEYYTSTGLVSRVFIGIVGPEFSYSYTHELVEYEVSGEATEVSVEWACSGDGFSSNLTYVREGLALLQDGKLVYITPEEFREVLAGDAVFAVYSKACPFCHQDWSHLLKTSEEVDVPIVMVILGPMIGERESTAARLEMNKASVEGTPTLVFYVDGRIVDKLVGFTPWDYKVEKIREVYGG